jgi:two-component system, oxyanion-binding sensor
MCGSWSCRHRSWSIPFGKGTVDGFCVGAPWNSLAVAAGAGTILHQGADIVRDCPEKVLAFRTDWAQSHEEDVRALAQAVADASRWAAAPGNRNSLIKLLVSVAGHKVSEQIIERILSKDACLPGPVLAANGLRLDEDDQGRSCPDGGGRSEHLFGGSC